MMVLHTVRYLIDVDTCSSVCAVFEAPTVVAVGLVVFVITSTVTPTFGSRTVVAAFYTAACYVLEGGSAWFFYDRFRFCW